MILTDIFGKKVNVENVRIELIKGYGEGEHGCPTLLLNGESSYMATDLEGNWTLKNKCSMLYRCPCNDENVRQLLEKKEAFEQQSKQISDQMHSELGVEDFMVKRVQWLVEHEYKIYEEDEVSFEERCHVYGVEVDEPEP